jgi:hypothetical protein
MMAEWDRYPLKNPEDVDRWWDDLGSDISLQGQNKVVVSSAINLRPL